MRWDVVGKVQRSFRSRTNDDPGVFRSAQERDDTAERIRPGIEALGVLNDDGHRIAGRLQYGGEALRDVGALAAVDFGPAAA